MGIPGSLLTSATRGYRPTGAFSLQFFKRGSGLPNSDYPLSEYFFLLGPNKYTAQFNFNLSVKNTYRGAVVTDFGNGLAQFSLSGELHAHYVGAPAKPSTVFGGLGGDFGAVGEAAENLATAGSSQLRNMAAPLDMINRKSGASDFFDLLWIIWHSRESFASYVGKQPSAGAFGFQGAFTIKTLGMPFAPFDFENIRVVYHDYDSDIHWEVVWEPNGWNFSQSAQDPMTWIWSLNMIGVRQIGEVHATVSEFPLPSKAEMLYAAKEILSTFGDILSFPLQFVSDIVDTFASIGSTIADLLEEVDAFVEENALSIRKIRQANARLNDGLQKLKSQIESFYLPNIVDRFDYYATSPNGLPAWMPLTPYSYGVKVTYNLTIYLCIQAHTSGPTFDNTKWLAMAPIGGIDNLQLALDTTYVSVNDQLMATAYLEVSMIQEQNTILSKDTAFYSVNPGETWESVAQKILGNASRAEELKIQNGIQFAGKDLSELVGKKIKIPVSTEASQTAVQNSSVFSEHKENPNDKDIEYEIFGEDISLTETGDFSAGYDGDIETEKGLDILVEHLLDRLSHPQGTIPLHPQWGAVRTPGELPDEVLELVDVNKVTDNLMQDPGVKNVSVNGVDIDGDSAYYDIVAFPIGGYNPFNVSIPRDRFRGTR